MLSYIWHLSFNIIVLSHSSSWMTYHCWIIFHHVATSFIYLLVNDLDCFHSCQLQITPPQTFTSQSLCGYISSFILDRHLKIEWLSWIGIYLTFSETSKLFSTVSRVWDLQFLYIFNQHLLWSIFSFRHSNRCRRYPLVIFTCIYLMTKWYWVVFMYLLAIYISSFIKMSVQHCCIFLWDFLRVWEFFMYYHYKSFSRYMLCK